MAKTKQRIDYLKNYRFADESDRHGPGHQRKNERGQAAFGFLQLKHIDRVLRTAPTRGECDTAKRS